MTRAEALAKATLRLKNAGVETPALDAKLLLLGTESIESSSLIASPETPLESQEKFDSAIARRCLREPVSKILGRRDFWKHRFIVNRDVLDPRPDTELLVETALNLATEYPPKRILDMGTGSGCILLSLLSELPDTTGIGTDVSVAALAVAKRNATALQLADRVDFMISDWVSALDETFNLVVSNPPYISSTEDVTLLPEVIDWDPEAALFAGMDGLQAYRKIANGLSAVLKPDGTALFEIGFGQATSVKAIFESAGFSRISSRFDMGGIERCLIVQQ